MKSCGLSPRPIRRRRRPGDGCEWLSTGEAQHRACGTASGRANGNTTPRRSRVPYAPSAVRLSASTMPAKASGITRRAARPWVPHDGRSSRDPLNRSDGQVEYGSNRASDLAWSSPVPGPPRWSRGLSFREFAPETPCADEMPRPVDTSGRIGFRSFLIRSSSRQPIHRVRSSESRVCRCRENDRGHRRRTTAPQPCRGSARRHCHRLGQ
jgi:hypothetical protein